jgi:Membrane-bound lysozyme-inhibitor of c-type lysozyme
MARRWRETKARFSPAGAPNGGVALTLDTGRELNLPQVMSADGGRYADADIKFWIKGQSATLTMMGNLRDAITSPRVHALNDSLARLALFGGAKGTIAAKKIATFNVNAARA